MSNLIEQAINRAKVNSWLANVVNHAAGVATEGSIGLPSETALSYVRAATALRAVCLQPEQHN